MKLQIQEYGIELLIKIDEGDGKKIKIFLKVFQKKFILIIHQQI